MTLKDFLRKFTDGTDKVQTHLSFAGGKYNIPEQHLTTFEELYFDELQKGGKMYLIEKISQPFAYFQDIDFKFDPEPEVVQTLIDITLDALCEHLHVQQSHLDYIVSKRGKRFHINYPKIVVKSDFATSITKAVKQTVEKKLSKIVADTIDTSVYRNGLRMLGSQKQEQHQDDPAVYAIVDPDTFQTVPLTLSLFRQTTIRRSSEAPITPILKEPRHLVKPGTKKPANGEVSTDLVEEICRLLNDTKADHQSISSFDFTPLKVVYVQNKAGLMCFYITIKETMCPFKEREHRRVANKQSSSLYVELTNKGMCVRCFDEDCARRRFPEPIVKLPPRDVTSTKYPELYKHLFVKYWNTPVEITDDLRELLEQSLSCTHYNVAKVVFNIYKDTFRVDDIRNTDWYEFDGTRWKKSYKMNINISEELPKYYNGLKVADSATPKGLDDIMGTSEADTNCYNELIDNLVRKLENVNFKNNVLNECKYLFYNHDPDFAKMLDSNEHLIGFKNGVFDMNTLTFRNGRQNDYITFSTGYDFIQYDETLPEVKDVYEFIRKILTNDAVREYTLKMLSRGLLGIPDEHFYIWTGLSGANGKSTLVNFLESTLGDYATSQDVALITNKRANSNAASPEVVEMRGKRMVFFQEPESNDRLRTGILKQYTGGDTIKARELFKSPVSFRSQASFVMCCNELPSMSSMDGGTWRRIRVTEFKSRFCENPVKHNEFAIDKHLKSKLKDWRPYFMSILCHYYQRYTTEGNPAPLEVCDATNKYKTDNDKFNDFFEECLQQNDSAFSTTNDIFSRFESWWRENYSTEKVPTKHELRRALKLKYSDEQVNVVFNKKFKGFALNILRVSDETESDETDAAPCELD